MIIIIGVLAAIALPVYLDQREQAFGATVQSDVRNGAGAATSYAADNNGSFAGMTAAILQGQYEWNLSPGVINPTVVVAAGGCSAAAFEAAQPWADRKPMIATDIESRVTKRRMR